MGNFVNTIDLLGDAVVVRNIVEKSITEFKDNKLTYVGDYAFAVCLQLVTVDLPNVTRFGECVLHMCNELKSLILRSNTLCSLSSSYNFMPTSVYMYVPRALVDSYKSDTQWSRFKDTIRALEDYTVDGTTTGELDPTKI